VTKAEAAKTKRQRDRVKAALLAGRPVGAIAKKHGWSYQRVRAIAIRLKVQLPKSLKATRNRMMIAAMRQGATIEQVAKRFNVGLSTARDVTREFRLSQIQK
jgi:hypothetical protein